MVYKWIITIENKVEKFSQEDVKQNNIPHVGFNNIDIIDDKNGFFKNLTNKSNFYFVHSYRMKPNNLKNDFALCNYGTDFLAAFKFRNIYGVQFHPEKSQSCGIQILTNFLKINVKKKNYLYLLYIDGFFYQSRNFNLQKVGDDTMVKKNYNFQKYFFFIDELIILNISRDEKNLIGL